LDQFDAISTDLGERGASSGNCLHTLTFSRSVEKIDASESVGLDLRLGDVRFSDLRSGNPSISDQPISHRFARE
jgi:hypothetical protein